MAVKKSNKKSAPKKSAPNKDDVTIPETTPTGATVRTITCDKEAAADLIDRFGFWVVSQSDDGKYVCSVDQAGNAKYEASR